MTKYKLYKNYDDGDTVIVPSSEVHDFAYCGESSVVYYDDESIDKQFAALNMFSAAYKASDIDFDDDSANKVVANYGMEPKFRLFSDYEVQIDRLVLSESWGISFMNDWESFMGYHYWNGSNWKMLDLSEYSLEIEFDGGLPFVSLDEWDGNNLQFGSTGEHEKILYLPNGRYLAWHTSQWQGTLDTGKLFENIEELKNYLEDVGVNNLDF